MYTEQIATDRIIIGDPILRNCTYVIGYPCLALIPDSTTFADAPIRVPFPPRHAPRDSAHQRGITSIPLSPMEWISGIIVATNGILSSVAGQQCGYPQNDHHRQDSLTACCVHDDVSQIVDHTCFYHTAYYDKQRGKEDDRRPFYVFYNYLPHSVLPMMIMITAPVSAMMEDSI